MDFKEMFEWNPEWISTEISYGVPRGHSGENFKDDKEYI